MLLALGSALVIASALLVVSSGQIFFADEWNVILRPDWSPDSLLTPLNEHIVAGQVVVYKVLLSLFGMGSTTPFRVANTGFLLTVVAITYVLVARRLGLGLAAIVAVVLALLGPAWEDLLWPAGISFMGAIAGGLGAFVAIERETKRGDAVACGLLVVSFSFSTLGLAFVVGIAVDVLLRGDRLKRAYIPAVPIALYLLWYLGYGSEVESRASLDNLLGAPAYVWHAASASLASLTGLGAVGWDSLGTDPGRGAPVLVLALLAASWAIVRRPVLLSRRLCMFLAAALFFWVAAAVNEVPGREPGASRYQLIGAILVTLIAAELLRGWRPARGWLALIGVLAAAAVVSNLGALRIGDRYLQAASDSNAAALAALDGARAAVPGDRVLNTLPGSPFTSLATAGQYFAAVDRWGLPIGNPDAAVVGPEQARRSADEFLAAALELQLTPVTDTAPGCILLSLGSSRGQTLLQMPPGTVQLESESGFASVRLRRWSRFGTSPVDLGSAPAGRVLIEILPDSFDQPWQAEIRSDSPVRGCALGG